MNVDLACKSFEYDNNEGWFQIMLKCTELVSVNSATQMNTKEKRVFDAPWTVRFKSELRDQLIFADPRGNCPWITNSQFYYIAVKYVLKQYFHSRDLDNLHKYTQDMIADACGINDSHILEVHMWKNFNPGDFEYMIIKFGISTYDYNQFR